MNIEEAAAQYLSGVPLRQIALEAHRDRVCMANAIKAHIGDKAFKEQARDNKRRGHTVRFDIASVDVSAVVRDWRLGANLAELRARYRFPTNKRVAEAIKRRPLLQEHLFPHGSHSCSPLRPNDASPKDRATWWGGPRFPWWQAACPYLHQSSGQEASAFPAVVPEREGPGS